ncbi:uncharacterized protein [Gossypium hirsutum]|uniref:Uncharacterized protein n=1 Tax=Gossypium hirsutum TaxID=3635 RepID=A0ABM2ZT73_GOSHI|nr:uncharacterized protein LOC121215427 [Gossypium hirsutum]
MKRLAVGPMTTPGYHKWWARRINDSTPKLNQEESQSIEEHLRVIPSKLEMVRQDFERKNADLEKRIEQMEVEKTNLRLDRDVQKLENERLKKEKNKADEELGSLKINYKKLRLSIRTAGLGKTSEQWRVETQKEKDKADKWEQRFQEMQRRNEALEKICQKARTKRYRSRNSTIELKASLSKIDKMKKRIEELETVLQNCEIQIKHLKANESRNNEQLHHFQSQVRSRDHLIEEAVVQIREVADHIQTLAVQADTLSVKYELESDRG